MRGARQWLPCLIGAGLCVGAVGCEGGDGDGSGGGADGVGDLQGEVSSALLPAKDCPDLLSKIQADAIMKARLAILQFKQGVQRGGDVAVGRPEAVDDGVAGGEAAPTQNAGQGDATSGGGGKETADPTSVSGTNSQVAGVDEADFVKLVQGGKRMFLLHGSKLFALKSWPAAELALDGEALDIEGSPSEMFVTEDGKRAVVFSTVFDYTSGIRGGASAAGAPYCIEARFCGGGQSFTKVTVADLSGDVPKAVRELYYEGSYLSSRRYPGDDKDVVRAVLQGYSRYAGLYSPDVSAYDAWGRKYDEDVIDAQLEAWLARTSAAISTTTLEDWLPAVREVKDKKLTTVEPACEGYYVPKAGLSDYGLTHLLSLDIGDPNAKLGGITVMGATSTVYSNAEHLVLAQPDYRWQGMDFGLVSEQQTALHMFAIQGEGTAYKASGWVPGFVPWNNSQFAIDEKGGVVRIATTAQVRDNPNAKPTEPAFWESHPENRVFTARPDGDALKIAGKTDKLGHPNETIYAARFVGDRGYVVTAIQQRDPLVVVDVKDPAQPTVLGQVEIPGFGQYVHPIDDDHLVTVGSNDSGQGVKLQLFDVSNPMKIPQPKTLDFGAGTSSEVAYNHKAFAYLASKKLLGVPLYNYGWNGNQFKSGLQVIRVSTEDGFTLLGEVDHRPLYAEQKCGYCDMAGCYDYSCGYQPEVRRGFFADSEDGTFVYSISFGGVIVNTLSDLDTPLKTVALPAPTWNEGSWHGQGGGDDGGTSSPPSDPGKPDVTDAVEPVAADAGVAME